MSVLPIEPDQPAVVLFRDDNRLIRAAADGRLRQTQLLHDERPVLRELKVRPDWKRRRSHIRWQSSARTDSAMRDRDWKLYAVSGSGG